MASNNTRIYLVAERDAKDELEHEYLVRAGNGAQAIRHITSKTHSAEVASQDDCLRLAGEGVKVEEAGAE